MPKIKDLMRAFLYEDIDEDEDREELEEEDTVIEKTMPEPVKVTFPEEEKAAPQPAAEPAPAVQPEPAPEQEPEAEPAKTTSIFDGLDASDISRPAPEKTKPQNRPARPYRYDRKKAERSGRYTPRSDAGYQAVISPIFGNVADSKKQFDRVHDAINLPKPDASFEMTRIISPMYGNDVPSLVPIEEIPAYQPKGRRKAAPSREEAARPASDVQSMMKKEPVAAPEQAQDASPVQGTLIEKGARE